MKQPSPAYLRHVACTAEDWNLFRCESDTWLFLYGAIFARLIVSVLFVRLFSAAGSSFRHSASAVVLVWVVLESHFQDEH